MSAIPQSILDALDFAQDAKDKADADLLTATVSAAAVTAAQAQAAADLTTSQQSNAALDTARERLDATLDVYLRPGALPPAVPTPPA